MKSQTTTRGQSPNRSVANHVASKPQRTVQKKNNTGLSNKLKSGIENLSGYSMDDVKVHYNSPAPAQLHAHAFAQGTNIHVAPGQERHVPHEAWHVVQQKQGRVRPTMQMKGNLNINDDKGLEKEADVMGAKATQLKVESPKKSIVKYINTSGNVIQGIFWERTPQGEYIWHEGPVIKRFWKQRNDPESGRQETRPGNGWIHRGDYGVWERKSALDHVTDQSPLLTGAISAGQDFVRAPTLGNAEQQLGEQSSKVAYAAKIVGATLGVASIVTIGSTFLTFSIPAWVSIASRLFSIGTMAARLGKWWYDVRDSNMKNESTFNPHVRNGIFVTISFAQAAVELSTTGGKYVFLTSGWHHELFGLLSAIAKKCKESGEENRDAPEVV